MWPNKLWQDAVMANEPFLSRLTSLLVCKVSHACDALHLCPDVSKDFPLVQSDLFTRLSAFESMFTGKYVAQARKLTQTHAYTHTVYR